MASHFESSELQLTPQLNPLFAYLVLVVGEVVKGGKLKIKCTYHKFQIIGWGASGAHDEYSKTVRPYVLFQNMDGAAAFPLDVLLSQNLDNYPPVWDVNESDAELLGDEFGRYSLVQISKKRPSRRHRKRIAKIQKTFLSIDLNNDYEKVLLSIDLSSKSENALAHEAAHAAEAAKMKKKKKK
jgi:hypothetical protein